MLHSLLHSGSRLQILSECIPKLIPYCSSVLLIDSLPGSVPTPTTHHRNPHSIPYITGIVNSDGQVLLINEVWIIAIHSFIHVHVIISISINAHCFGTSIEKCISYTYMYMYVHVCILGKLCVFLLMSLNDGYLI